MATNLFSAACLLRLRPHSFPTGYLLRMPRGGEVCPLGPSVCYTVVMRFNVRFLLLYVIPCVAIAAALWTSTSPPDGVGAQYEPEYFYSRLKLCSVVSIFWILTVQVAPFVLRSMGPARRVLQTALCLAPCVAAIAWVLTTSHLVLPTQMRVLAIVLITTLWICVVGSLTPYDGKVHRRGPVRLQDDP